jgi:hypothetical protein
MTEKLDTGWRTWRDGTTTGWVQGQLRRNRESGDVLAGSYPAARIAAPANRAFLQRVRHHGLPDA